MNRDRGVSEEFLRNESLILFSPVILTGKPKVDAGGVTVGGSAFGQENSYTLYNVSNSAVSLGHVLGAQGHLATSSANDDGLPKSSKKWVVENQDISDLYDILKRVADRPLIESQGEQSATFLSAAPSPKVAERLHIGAGVLGAYIVVLFVFLWGVGEVTNIVFVQPIIALFGLVTGGTFVLMEMANRHGWEP